MPNSLCLCLLAMLCFAPSDDQPPPSTKKPTKPGAASGVSAPQGQTASPGTKSSPSTKGKVDDLWTMDPDKMKRPKEGLVGRLNGEPFQPNRVKFENQVLTFASGTDFLADHEITIFLFADLKELTAKPLVVRPKHDPGDLAPHIHVHSAKKTGQGPDAAVYTDNYAMKLELRQEKDGQIRGTIHLCLPDNAKSFLAGAFTVKDSNEKEDVTVPSGKISGVIRMTLPEKRSHVSLTVFGVDSQGRRLEGGSVGIDARRGEASIASSGDIDFNIPEQSNPTYQVNSTAVGTYLVVFSVNQVPVAWKWIEWKGGQPVGGDLEVSNDSFAALEVRFKQKNVRDVRVLPLWDGDRSPAGVGDGAEIVKQYAQAVRAWTAPVTAGQTSVKFPKLKPGRYRVFVGQSHEDVDIQPGRPAKVEVK